MHYFSRAAWQIVMVFFFWATAFSQQAPTVPPLESGSPTLPPVERIGPGVFRIGEIQISKSSRSLIFPAQVNMDKGLLEYLIVSSTGKTHESLLKTDVHPYLLQVAFLLLGFEATSEPLSAQGDPEMPRGEPVDVTFIYSDHGKNREIPAHEWVVMKVYDKVESPRLNWVYTGSKIVEGRFLAGRDGSVAAIYRDPAALIDHATFGGHSDDVWFAREGTVPPVGTRLTVIIRGRSKTP